MSLNSSFVYTGFTGIPLDGDRCNHFVPVVDDGLHLFVPEILAFPIFFPIIGVNGNLRRSSVVAEAAFRVFL
jgi:hypothetical protein